MEFQEDFHLDFWHKHYLQLELQRFEITLKHFFEIGLIKPEDYQFLSSNLKMIKTFLKANSETVLKQRHTEQDYWSNSYDYKQHFLHKHLKSKRTFSHSDLKQLSLFNANNPLPIVGKIEITGLNERLDALKAKEPQKNGTKFPFKIPAGTHWDSIIINFLNEEQIEIKVKRFRHITNFKEMGMIGKGNVPKPNEQWVFLKVLAQCNGEITIQDSTARDKYKKQKQELTEILQRYFSIDYDPFYPYKSSHEKSGNSYKIKLTLIPPPVISVPNTLSEIEEDTFGIQEFLTEEAPQVID